MPTHIHPGQGSGARLRGRRLVAATAAVLGMVGALVGVTTGTSAAAASCEVDYKVVNQWPGGFQAEINITNVGGAIDGWTLTFDFPNGQTITQGWSASYSQSGSTVSASNLSWNGSLGAGATVSPGFIGSHGGANGVPTSFALNGQSCNGDGGQTTTTQQQTTTTAQQTTTTAQQTTTTAQQTTTTTAQQTTTTQQPPLSGEFFVDPESGPLEWVQENPGDSRASVIRDRIATKPMARWYNGQYADTEGNVRDYVNQAKAQGKIPILVGYNVPDRDCGQASGGGASDFAAYQQWVDRFVAGLGDGPAYIVWEPDAIPLNDCASDLRFPNISEAVGKIKNSCSGCQVYLDAGHSAWIGASEMAQRLRDSGVMKTDGFATNTSNYQSTSAEIAFGKALLNALGNPSGMAQVIDTSRNGNGPAPGNPWCDPDGRKIGQTATTNTGESTVDALLWTKIPGEADGCIAGAGQFVPQRAYELALG